MSDSIETIYEPLRQLFEIPDGVNGTVRTFKLAEIPAVITPEMVPCAIPYPTDIRLQYSASGPTIFYWYGQTDYHLTKDVKPANIGYILPFFGRVFASCAQSILLAPTATFSLIQEEAAAMTFVTYKNATGEKDDHQGIVVRWRIQQNVSGQYTIS